MDDYKEKLIEMVRARPLLWDPRVPDYKNKDQRTQVWDELKELLTAPKDADGSSKNNAKVFEDKEISNIVDSVIEENDEDGNGYIEYFEFKRRQASSREGTHPKQQPPQQQQQQYQQQQHHQQQQHGHH